MRSCDLAERAAISPIATYPAEPARPDDPPLAGALPARPACPLAGASSEPHETSLLRFAGLAPDRKNAKLGRYYFSRFYLCQHMGIARCYRPRGDRTRLLEIYGK